MPYISGLFLASGKLQYFVHFKFKINVESILDIYNLVPRLSPHIPQGEEKPWLELVTWLPDSGC
jgi:hypothetical protein